MCGIVGYVGASPAKEILVNGLKRLEYRGYDSSGLVIINDRNEAESVKAVGKIASLEEEIGKNHLQLVGNIGIAHTRWATHGKPTVANAHPHSDCQQKIWLVHNGIIENYQILKEKLIAKGHEFRSETDTEIIVHLIEDCYQGDLLVAIRKALPLLVGTYGLAIIHSDHPDKLYATKNGSPLLLGIGDKETIVASDASAVVSRTQRVVYLENGEIAEITGDGFKIYDSGHQAVDKDEQTVEWTVSMAERGGHKHFMIKEINEQPEAIENSIRGRYVLDSGNAKLGGLLPIFDRLKKIDRLLIVACGTARHAGLVGEYMIEEYAGVPVEVDYASEFRYRQPIIDENTAVLAISQSGETADTLAAIKEAKEKGALVLGIVNVVGSSLSRETDAGIYNHIGPEISVASTKAFTSQVSILALLAVYLGRTRKMSLVTGQRIIKELGQLPGKVKQIIEKNEAIREIAEKYVSARDFAFLGRKYNCAVALEGALKLKEISYIHAEGFVSGEMKHGSIAMIDEGFPTVFIVPQDSVYEKNLSNLQEIKARNGRVIALATEGDDRIKELADDVIYIPKTLEMLTPVLATIPLQLFAYHFADLLGRDIDKPRNLAKSVTVE